MLSRCVFFIFFYFLPRKKANKLINQQVNRLESITTRPVSSRPRWACTNEFCTSRWIVTERRPSEAAGNVSGKVYFHTAGFPVPSNEPRFSPLAGSYFLHSCTGWNWHFGWALTASSQREQNPSLTSTINRIRDRSIGDVIDIAIAMQRSYGYHPDVDYFPISCSKITVL